MVPVSQYRNVRIEFSKTGRAKFISHLDLNRTLKTAFTRAKVPIWYTNGFNPHPKLVFSLPLALGAESMCEFLDIRVLPPFVGNDIKKALNANLPNDIRIKKVYTPQTALEDMHWAVYDFVFYCKDASDELAQKIKDLLSAPLVIEKRTKKTKSGLIEADISEGIKAPETLYEDGKIKLTVTLCTRTDGYVNPEYIIKAMSRYLGVDFEGKDEYYSVMKRIALKSDLATVFE